VSDPFRIDGPTCISFSGGRTSGYMLWRVLQAHGGKLPADCHVVFANTGKEDEATLRFVRDCSERWAVPISWVEYRPDGWALVDFDSASRNGEPFDALIKKRNYLPNPVARFCTVELKILRAVDYMRSLGYAEHENLIGLRADEPSRIAKLRADPTGGTKGVERRAPLADAGVTKQAVARFWLDSDFDLGLPNHNGSTPWGNCDLCFLKHSATVMSLIAEKPSRAVWWAAKEGSITNPSITNGGTFRADRPTYAQMLKFVGEQRDAFGHEDDGIECLGCTD
jgi:3'-phosphoadenosine 5'-phosphosulfate sulfotransferase (PAPS reductase)/FAD synthetase